MTEKGRPGVTEKKRAEREFEIGKDESWFANIKRTYDEFQQESLESIRQHRTLFDKILTDAQQHDNARQAIANQALQNAVETANLVGKQTIRHADIAIDQQWNLEPSEAAGEAVVLRSVTIDDASLKAIGAVVAAAVAEALTRK